MKPMRPGAMSGKEEMMSSSKHFSVRLGRPVTAEFANGVSIHSLAVPYDAVYVHLQSPPRASGS